MESTNGLAIKRWIGTSMDSNFFVIDESAAHVFCAPCGFEQIKHNDYVLIVVLNVIPSEVLKWHANPFPYMQSNRASEPLYS